MMISLPKLLFLVSLFSLVVAVIEANENLYDVLGVRKSASQSDVKKAYKKLAREWHPDKNSDPNANERFMKINEAYETLGDPEKRRDYDQFGRTTATPSDQQPRWGGGGGGFRRGFGSFESFFAGGPFGGGPFNFGGFNFGADVESGVEKYIITYRNFEEKILPQSYEKPYLIYIYRDFCYACMEVERIWDRIVQDTETIGMGLGSVNVQLDRYLTNRLRVSSLPSMVAIINGRVKWFSGGYSIASIRVFIRGLFDPTLIIKVNKENYDSFLGSWKTNNKVRALLFANREEPSLRFLLAAHAHKHNIAVGYINTNGKSTLKIQNRFKVNPNMETMLLFKENTNTPVASSSMETLSRGILDETFEANEFLTLPRLSNQRIFNDLCPPFSSRSKKKLCVVLLTQRGFEHDPFRDTFRQHATEQLHQYDRVKYAYMFEEAQKGFVNEITNGGGAKNGTNSLKVVLLWRQDKEKMHYGFLPGGWPEENYEDFDDSASLLNNMVDNLLSSSKMAALTSMLMLTNDLVDEHLAPLYVRIPRKFFEWTDKFYERCMSILYNIDEVTLVTVFAGGFVAIAMFVMMRSMITLENERVADMDPRKRAQKRRQQANAQIKKGARPTVYLHPLSPDSFNQLIIDLDPGVRSVIILINTKVRDKLLQDFATIVHPYAGTEAFNFGFLQLEEYSGWYRHLLEETLEYKRNLTSININNCIGTVLAINGHRKYYSVFHAQRLPKQTAGNFVGLDDSSQSESEEEDDRLFECDLLSGLTTWMERLCEGTINRYRVEYWPSMEAY